MKYWKMALGAVSIACASTIVLADRYNMPIDAVHFENHTDLGMNAKIAGLPGKPIPAHATHYPVPYMAVMSSCGYTGMEENCPIEFFDQKNGALVATVYIRSKTAEIIGAPVLHGEYANKMKVSGWETVPVQHIVIEYR